MESEAATVINIPRDSTLRQTNNTLCALAALQSGQCGKIDDWNKFTTLVRAGLGPQLFPVGSRHTVHHQDYGDIEVTIVDYDHYPHPYDSECHTALLMLNGLPLPCVQWDAPEAIFTAFAKVYGEMYYHIVAEPQNENEGEQAFCFRLEKDIPVGGQIVVYDDRVVTYPSADSANAIEIAKILPYKAGVSLGTLGDGKDCNTRVRMMHGCSDWGQSCMQRMLYMHIWKPSNRFDRSNGTFVDIAAEIDKLDPDFLHSCGEVDVNGEQRAFFLFSEDDVSSCKLFQRKAGRIVKQDHQAVSWWTRTVHGDCVAVVTADGMTDNRFPDFDAYPLIGCVIY